MLIFIFLLFDNDFFKKMSKCSEKVSEEQVIKKCMCNIYLLIYYNDTVNNPALLANTSLQIRQYNFTNKNNIHQ